MQIVSAAIKFSANLHASLGDFEDVEKEDRRKNEADMAFRVEKNKEGAKHSMEDLLKARRVVSASCVPQEAFAKKCPDSALGTSGGKAVR